MWQFCVGEQLRQDEHRAAMAKAGPTGGLGTAGRPGPQGMAHLQPREQAWGLGRARQSMQRQSELVVPLGP